MCGVLKKTDVDIPTLGRFFSNSNPMLEVSSAACKIDASNKVSILYNNAVAAGQMCFVTTMSCSDNIIQVIKSLMK